MRASIETRRFSPLGKIDDLKILFIESFMFTCYIIGSENICVKLFNVILLYNNSHICIIFVSL